MVKRCQLGWYVCDPLATLDLDLDLDFDLDLDLTLALTLALNPRPHPPPCPRQTAILDPFADSRANHSFFGIPALYKHRKAHFVDTQPAANEQVTRATTPFKQKCQYSVGTAGSCGTDGSGNAYTCCAEMQMMGSTQQLGNCDPISTTGKFVDCSNAPMSTVDCAVFSNMADCAACTDSNAVACGSGGRDTFGAAQVQSVGAPPTGSNATVGFGTDDEDYRFGGKDWNEAKRMWCGAKLLLESYEGFFGITIASGILFGISVIMTIWDDVTMIEEKSRAKRFAQAFGIILTEILNLLLYLLPAFKTAMLIHVGHPSAPEAASLPEATTVTMFLDTEYAWASGTYRAITVLIVLVQFCLCFQTIGMLMTTKDRNARVIGVCKIIFVTVGLAIMWTPNFDIFPAIQEIDDGLPKFDKLKKESAKLLAERATQTHSTGVMLDRLEGARQLKPQLDIGREASGNEVLAAWILTLLIGVADQVELVLLAALAKREKAKGGKVSERADTQPPAADPVKV